MQPPGREGRLRDRPLTNIRDVAGALADSLPLWLDRPFAVFGHSLGGLIAFELVRELRRRSLAAPVRLFVSATRAPQLPYPHPPLRHLDDENLLREVNRRYGGSVPREVQDSAELRELFAPPLRCDLAALETYTYATAERLECPISVFGGTADPTVSSSSLEAWQEQTSGGMQLRMIDGGHLFLQTARQALLDSVKQDLGAAPDLAPQ